MDHKPGGAAPTSTVDFRQPLPRTHHQDLLSKQHQPVGTHQTRSNRGRADKEEVELESSKEKEKVHNQTGTNMEPTRQAEQRTT